jgi:hypothetical protein
MIIDELLMGAGSAWWKDGIKWQEMAGNGNLSALFFGCVFFIMLSGCFCVSGGNEQR